MDASGSLLDRLQEPAAAASVEHERRAAAVIGAEDERDPGAALGGVGGAFVTDCVELHDADAVPVPAHRRGAVGNVVPLDACLGRGNLYECHLLCMLLLGPARALEQAFDSGSQHTERMF
jgi:hypothetical protein